MDDSEVIFGRADAGGNLWIRVLGLDTVCLRKRSQSKKRLSPHCFACFVLSQLRKAGRTYVPMSNIDIGHNSKTF